MADKERERNEQLGGVAGLGAGVLAGAQVGTVVLPIPVVGTFTGALVGGILGSAVGQRVGGAALTGVNAFLDELTGQGRDGGKNGKKDDKNG
jgi:phage tail tape-measure protein